MTPCGLSACRLSSKLVSTTPRPTGNQCTADNPGLVDIDRLVQTDAFRIVLLVLKDGPSELGPSVAALLAFLANMPHTRHRLVPGSDLEVSGRPTWKCD